MISVHKVRFKYQIIKNETFILHYFVSLELFLFLEHIWKFLVHFPGFKAFITYI